MRIAHAKNGGPIAMITKDNLIVIGPSLPRNKVFIFAANGKHWKTINLEDPVFAKMGLKASNKHNIYKHWAGIYFNADEDLVMLSAEGCVYIIDIVLAEIKDFVQMPEFMDPGVITDKVASTIVDSRFD
jgi:hypothetical protein